MPETKRPLKVFLCRAHNDKEDVRELYNRLVKDGVDAWMDKAKLLPGQDWELEIRKAVRASDVIVVCLSKQFNNAGFRQKEVRLALDTAMEKPDGEIFIIPARLEVCENLESLKKWHWVDLFEDNGYDMLLRALRARSDSMGATLRVKRRSTPKVSSPRVKFERPAEEDEPAASSPDESPAKKAVVDARVISPELPSIAKRKPFKLKTEYMVAIIGAVATILAALIGSPWIGTWFTQSPASTATVTRQAQASLTESFALSLPTETLSPAHPNPSPGSDLQRGSTIRHVVTTGESLLQIARCYGADFEAVRNANPQISDPKILSSGMPAVTVPNIGSNGEIYGPPCVTFYNVQSSDTWDSIADRYNADQSVLIAANENIPLTPGHWIIIPYNSTRARSLTLPVTHEDEVDPTIADPYAFNIYPGQVISVKITNTTSKVFVTFDVQDPNEEVYINADDVDIAVWGFPNAESGNYEIRIFNQTSSTIAYTLEISLSQ
jgi:hypothetical protein